MLQQSLVEKLNDQLNFELHSAYVYFAMAADMDHRSLDGFANWMKIQAQEEIQHAMRIYNYVNDRGAKVELAAQAQPKGEFASVAEVFEVALQHEVALSERLNELAGVALELKDNTTYSFLEWFLTEQVEEVSMVQSICDKVKMIGDNGYGLLQLSDELGKRQPEADGGQ